MIFLASAKLPPSHQKPLLPAPAKFAYASSVLWYVDHRYKEGGKNCDKSICRKISVVKNIRGKVHIAHHFSMVTFFGISK